MAVAFISYRRTDATSYARFFKDRLEGEFGPRSVFMDFDIAPGEDYVETLTSALQSSAVLLVVIGDRWIDRDRLAGPGDWVRFEIEAALEQQKPILPVIVGRGQMPTEADLPDSIRRLARRQALEVTDARWDVDVARLVDAVKALAKPRAAQDDAEPADLEADDGDTTFYIVGPHGPQYLLERLPGIVQPGERLTHACRARYTIFSRIRQGYLALTDRRLIWVDDGFLRGETPGLLSRGEWDKSLPFETVSAMSWREREECKSGPSGYLFVDVLGRKHGISFDGVPREFAIQMRDAAKGLMAVRVHDNPVRRLNAFVGSESLLAHGEAVLIGSDTRPVDVFLGLTEGRLIVLAAEGANPTTLDIAHIQVEEVPQAPSTDFGFPLQHSFLQHSFLGQTGLELLMTYNAESPEPSHIQLRLRRVDRVFADSLRAATARAKAG